MAKNLVIVESPAKAKTIEGFLGSDFTVKSSYGHVRDLVKERNGVDISAGFKPIYEVQPDKEKVINELLKLTQKAETVWLASDEDREGEAISWHLKEVLNVPDEKAKRIVFHEITKQAILKAIAQPRTINKNLVDAQQARRILDRLVGFELSPILWKKVRPSLSAGRVQSVSVRLIVERERAITHFKTESFYKIVGVFKTKNNSTQTVKAELNQKFKTKEEATKWLEDANQGDFSVESVEVKPFSRKPTAPFTTSTLQQEANRKLRWNVNRIMRVAQTLYESGKITYMRTDSVNLSDQALKAAENEIKSAYGNVYAEKRQFKTKSAGAQEAHEAIRPTFFENHTISGSADEIALYELIWKRAIASQMAEAQLERTTVKIKNTKANHLFVAQGEVILFDGFLKVYLEGVDDEEEDENENQIMPKVSKNDPLEYLTVTAKEGFTKPQPRFSEASLIQKLEELGIGRPSTYSPTITTIQERGYVTKEDREGFLRKATLITLNNNIIKESVVSEKYGTEKAKLFPSNIGMIVNDFLIDHFPDILDFKFTAKVESDFDNIATGKLDYQSMLQNFYFSFHEQVIKTSDSGERATGERILGVDPETGKTVSVRMSKYGPVAMLAFPDNETEKPVYASLRAGQFLEEITLAQALSLFTLPRTIGQLKGEDVIVNNGRFGPYLKIGEKNVSLDKNMDPYTITLDEVMGLLSLPRTIGVFENHDIIANKGKFGPYVKLADKFYSLQRNQDPLTIDLDQAIAIILEGRQKEAEKTIATYPEQDIVVMKGRFGPYIKQKSKLVNLPKQVNLDEITLDICLDLLSKQVDSPKATKGKSKTTTSKKTTKKAKK